MGIQQHLALGSHEEKTPTARRWKVKFVRFVALSLVTGWLIWGSGLRDSEIKRTKRFGFKYEGLKNAWRWSEVKPTKALEWHQCYEKYDCARLDVPLDWPDPSEELRASIALIRYNATDRINYKGPVIINPGGPGGSGIWFVKRLAPYYQAVVGQNHDIISFDPRGVGASTPLITCFSSPQSSALWGLQSTSVIDAHPGVLYDAYTRAEAYSQACASSINSNTSSAGQFVSTASTARDMLEIMQKLGEEKLQYWGFSYGSYLGLTFASMFPDKVGRMVLDGNVDAIEFSSAQGCHYLKDTDNVMSAFYTTCHAAGPKVCSFHSTSPSEIETRLSTLLENIRKHPVIVPGSSAGERPEIVSYSTLRRVISSSLYRPLVMFPLLADALSALELGDGLPLLMLSDQGFQDSLLCNSENNRDRDGHGVIPAEDEDSEVNEDASNAILCSDNGGWPENATVEDFGAYVKELEARSKSAGATMAEIAMGCVGWNVKAKWKFSGPFEGNTSHPILFIANKADNITPLWSARRNSKGFPSSEVLIQNTYGHTSLAAPSRCTAQTIQEYFQSGVLPARDTVCEADLQPFQPFDESKGMTVEREIKDEDLDFALLELMKAPVIGA